MKQARRREQRETGANNEIDFIVAYAPKSHFKRSIAKNKNEDALKKTTLFAIQLSLTLAFSFIVSLSRDAVEPYGFGWEYGGMFWEVVAFLASSAFFYLPVWIAVAIRVAISCLLNLSLHKHKVACIVLDLGVSILTSLFNWFCLTRSV